jgi:2-methylisocitrate lyase-like PEP mutase family enzyme
VAAAVGKPLNVVMSAADPELTAQDLAGAGVKRISVGGALSRLAFAAVRDAAVAMLEGGNFKWVRDTMATQDLKAIFSR